MNKPAFQTKFGQSAKRREDVRLLHGKGQFVDDMTLPDQVYAAFVRSQHAHANLSEIDISAAQEMPGVLRILTGADIAATALPDMPPVWMTVSEDGTQMKVGERPALASKRVRYVGEPIAVVIAQSQSEAVDAAEAVFVDYQELPAVVDLARAMADDTGLLHDGIANNCAFNWTLGELGPVDEAFSKAAHVVNLTLKNNRLVPNAIEPRSAIALWDGIDEKLLVYMGSQNPIGMRSYYAAIFGLAAENRTRVVSPDVGGGFGSKAHNYPEELVIAWAAKLIDAPVKWTATRTESFLTDAHGRDHLSDVSLALNAEGKFLALKVDTLANLGSYVSSTGSLIPTFLYGAMLSGQYEIPAIFCRTRGIYTNTCPVDAYRGAGRPEATYVIERIVNVAAEKLGIDQVEIRRRNLIRSFPYQTPVVYEYDSGDYERCLDAALELGQYASFADRRAVSESKGLLRGIGVSAYVEACGVGPTALLAKLGGKTGRWESAEVRVNPTGTVEVLTGMHSHGQGHKTTFAQVVADCFGIETKAVSIVQGDTDRLQAGNGTFASRSSVGISAAVRACDKIIDKSKQIVAHLLEVSNDSVSFVDGQFVSTQSNETLSFRDIAREAHAASGFPTAEIEPGLVASSFFDPPNFTFSSGVYICEVEIDPATGVVDIASFAAVDDFGNVVNPMIVEGQVHGGLAQGIGQALWENSLYDNDTGQLITASFMDYGMPRASGLPDFKLGFAGVPSPSNPLGMKGCGEAGAIGAPPAVINAITNALEITHVDMPATPEKIWRICNDMGGK